MPTVRSQQAKDCRPQPRVQPAIAALLSLSLLLLAPLSEASTAAAEPLRVCADPNNLPFSNDRGEGFENKLAALIAQELGRPLQYTWWPQRRGFVRNTLKAGLCDLIVGVPAGFDMTATTAPYYRSSYVLVSRQDRKLGIERLEDERLRELRIGVHTIGDDYSNVPPAHVLASLGLANNLRGYSIYGDYGKPNPPRKLIDAVASGEIDVAVAWGPLAGYFAAQSQVPLLVQPLPSETAGPLPMQFAISMGLRRGDDELKQAVETVLQRRRGAVDALLQAYHVPVVTLTGPVAANGKRQP